MSEPESFEFEERWRGTRAVGGEVGVGERWKGTFEAEWVWGCEQDTVGEGKEKR